MILRCVLLLLALSTAACERVEVDSNNKSTDPEASPGSSPLAGTQPGLVQRMAAARQSLAFQGVRRVELVAFEGTQERRLVLRERVSADGEGGFAIEALEVIEPPLSGSERDVFLSLQSLRQGMHWRYRDFTIHDAGLFAQNYRLIDTGATTTVAGIGGLLQLTVERQDLSGTSYNLAVDPSTGLVLASREATQEGQLVCDMSFESLQWSFDEGAVPWHQPRNNESALPTTGSLEPWVGFADRAPRTLPAGYQLLERASLMHPQDSGLWTKSTYSDGVEALFFLHGGPIQNGNGIRSGVPEIQADLVEVALAAPWTVATGNLHGQRVMALGKVSEPDLLRLLSSAME